MPTKPLHVFTCDGAVSMRHTTHLSRCHLDKAFPELTIYFVMNRYQL